MTRKIGAEVNYYKFVEGKLIARSVRKLDELRIEQ